MTKCGRPFVPRVAVPCRECGTELLFTENAAARHHYAICPPCRFARVDWSCRSCGVTRQVTPSQARHTSRCEDCRTVTHPMEQFEGACETCGVHFTKRVSAGTRVRFCGNPCRLAWFSVEFRGDRSPQWQGGSPTRYGAHWKATRHEVYERDGNRCRACAIERAPGVRLIAAHLTDRRWFLDRGMPAELADHPANLVALCNPCHVSFDRNPATRWDHERCDRGFWPDWAAQRVAEQCDWAEQILLRYRPHLLRSPLTSSSHVSGDMLQVGDGS